jgi:DNA-binding GntR family transcriptional regulator
MTRQVDHDSDRAFFRQLADILRERIESGDLPPGARLPTEIDLTQEHGVGRDSVRDALAILRSEGLIVTEPRVGSRVRDVVTREPITPPPGSRAWARMPTAQERRQLRIPEGTPVLIVSTAGDEKLHRGDLVEIAIPG